MDRLCRLERVAVGVPDHASRTRSRAAMDVARRVDGLRGRGDRLKHVRRPRTQQAPGPYGAVVPRVRTVVLVARRRVLDLRVVGGEDAVDAVVGRPLLHRLLPARLRRDGATPAQGHGPTLATELAGRTRGRTRRRVTLRRVRVPRHRARRRRQRALGRDQPHVSGR